jgi:hypothetical protein
MTTAHIDVFGIPSSTTAHGERHVATFGDLSIECPSPVPAGAVMRINASLIDGRWVASSVKFFTLVAGEPNSLIPERERPQVASALADDTGHDKAQVQPQRTSAPAPRAVGASSPFASLARRTGGAAAGVGAPQAAAQGEQKASMTIPAGDSGWATSPTSSASMASKSVAQFRTRPPFDPDNMDADEDIPF